MAYSGSCSDPFDYAQLEGLTSKTPESVNNTITERTSAWLFGDEAGYAQSWTSSVSAHTPKNTGYDSRNPATIPGLSSEYAKDTFVPHEVESKTDSFTETYFSLPIDTALSSEQRNLPKASKGVDNRLLCSISSVSSGVTDISVPSPASSEMSNSQDHAGECQDSVIPIIDIEHAPHRERLIQRVNSLSDLMTTLDGAAAHKWNSQFKDPSVRNHFKVQRRQVSSEELVKDFFVDEKFGEFCDLPIISNLRKKFAKVLTGINVPDHEFADTIQNRRWLLDMLESARRRCISGDNEFPPRLAPSDFNTHWFNLLSCSIVGWLNKMIGLIQQDVTETMETNYVDMFRALMICFSIDVNDGRNAHLNLGNTTCNPDLLLKSVPLGAFLPPGVFYPPRGVQMMPLEAKSARFDPDLAKLFKEKHNKKKAERLVKEKEAEEKKAKEKKAKEKKDKERHENQGDTEIENLGDTAPGPSNEPDEDVIQVYESEDDLISDSGSASDSDDPSASPRNASDNGHSTSAFPPASIIAGTSREMSSGDDDHEIPRKKRRVFFSSWSGSPLRNNTRETIKAFFSQLLGEVVALQEQNPSKKAIGIGVVGYKIVFLAYYGHDEEEKLMKLGDVPKTPGAKTMVQITKPLSIFNAGDRDEIALVLLAIGIFPRHYIKC